MRALLDGPATGAEIEDASGATTLPELRALADRCEIEAKPLAGRRVGVRLHGEAASFALLAALDALACDVFLFAGDLRDEAAVELGERLRLAAVLDADRSHTEVRSLRGEAPGSGASSLAILTSGTTGAPKAVRHTWTSLLRPIRRRPELAGSAWLLCYRPHLYAGLQVALQCLATGGRLVIPRPGAEPGEIARAARDAEVRFASATPSWWRRLLLLADPALVSAIPLEQITVGGECADQRTLDWLRRAFPAARLVHIYATTELGRCFSVSDGRAGFPARLLDAPTPDGVELRVESGELVVRSANAMQRYDAWGGARGEGGRWFRTGDLVERHGDRMLFVGRRSDLINVGGAKVNPSQVERAIEAVAGVRDSRVFPRPSSLMGQLVACEIAVAPGHEPAHVIAAVHAHCRTVLAPHERPRLVQVVGQVATSPAGKKVRAA